MSDAEAQPPPSRPDRVTLREVTAESLRDVLNLGVAEHQKEFVASNARSFAEAHFSEHAWFRAIYAGDDPVGFAMVYDDPEAGEYFLWRFMIDAEHQGRGYGRAALEQIVAHVRKRPKATKFYTSYVPGEGAAGASTGAWGSQRRER